MGMTVIAPPGFLNPMTTAGDIITGGAAGIPTRLAASATAGQALLSNGPGLALSWGAAGLVNPMTTQGDLIVGGVAGVATRLAASATAGQALLSNGTGAALTWGAAGMANPMTTAGDIIQGGAAGVPTRLAASATAGQTLQSNGAGLALSWGTAGMTNPMTTVGDLIVGGAAGAPARLAAGATGQTALLTNGSATTPSWGSPPSAQDVFYRPSAALYETFNRIAATGGTFPTTAVLFLTSIYLPSGLVIGHIAFMSGAGAAGSPLNSWFGLYDNNRVQLATTADQGAAAWASNTLKSLAIATIASGASSTFTTTYAGLHYLGFMMKATSTINCQGISVPLDAVAAVSPLVAGNSDTAQTTPPAFPHTATAITGAIGTAFYGYVAA